MEVVAVSQFTNQYRKLRRVIVINIPLNVMIITMERRRKRRW